MIVPRRGLRFAGRAAVGLLLTLSLLLVTAAPAHAILVNFDDIDASAGDVDLTSVRTQSNDSPERSRRVG
jgi:hypothetical protein